MNWSKKLPKVLHLDQKEVFSISSSLKTTIDVSQSARLKANLNKGFVGIQPNGKGFYISEKQAKDWIDADSRNQEVLKLSASATDLTDNPHGNPNRWIIDFADMSIEDVSEYKLPLTHIKTYVKPERDINREAVLKEKWWRFKRTNEALRTAVTSIPYYFVVPRHSKWFTFVPISSNSLPTDSTTVIASDDYYIFGILTSRVHRSWVKAQSSTLKGDTRYTHNTCFETFPFPQSPSAKLIEQIRNAALELHQYRTEQMEKRQWGITKMYNEWFHEPSTQLVKLHAKLDKLVLQAYNFSPNDDILTKLLDLNQTLAQKEQCGESVVGAWAPSETV